MRCVAQVLYIPACCAHEISGEPLLADGSPAEPVAAVALAARDEAWRQRLGKVLLDLRTVREVLQRELQQAGS